MSNPKTRSAKEIAAHLFRVGGKMVNEESFKLDSNLVYEMYDRGLRVQDLVEALVNYRRRDKAQNGAGCSDPFGKDPINNFLSLYSH